MLAPLYYTISPIKTEREGVIYNKKKLKVLCREGRFVSMEGRFVLAPLYYTISPIKTEGEGIIYNKKIKGVCRERHFVSMEGHFVLAPLYYTISPIKTEREGVIYNKNKLKVLSREGRFVAMDVLYLWTFCRLDVL